MIYRMYRQMDSGLELGFYVETTGQLSEPEFQQLQWLIAETFEPAKTGLGPSLTADVVEIGPRLSIETPFSSNAVSICQAMGLGRITRIERFKKFQQVLLGKKEKVAVNDIDIRNYSKYLLREGKDVEKRELLGCLQGRITLSEKVIILSS